ncbi:MAG: hypothetical protein CR986_02265 [Ignavibacteriae bacterium]|nr:MAG: hypothetical protein CR986_02265 [Ignavibacteriota bacterium]
MNKIKEELSLEVKLKTLAQIIYNESSSLGFGSTDYLRLMNELMDMTIKNKQNGNLNKRASKDIKVSELPLKTKNLIIRKFDKKKDLPKLTSWLNDENNKMFLHSTTSKNNLSADNVKTNGENIFATITLKDKTPIGLMALLNIDKNSNKAEMRKMIGDPFYKGRGYGKEASKAWLLYSTEILNINKIYITTIETNIRNISINRQLGFRIEGLLRGEHRINDVSYDVLRMAYFKNKN